MGSDIHLHVEVQNSHGYWSELKPKTPCGLCKGEGHLKNENGASVCFWCSGNGLARSFYHRRNYDLFAQLANVRNGYGVAGCKTGEGFKPIHKPKGFPYDAGEEVFKAFTDWGNDAHTPSYLTVAELLAYPIDDLRTEKTGIMAVETYFAWEAALQKDPNAWPAEWCSGISGPSVSVADSADDIDTKTTHVRAHWEVSYRKAGGEFWEKTLPQLLEIAETFDGSESVRIVFWFDN